jgi:hypothetical protein
VTAVHAPTWPERASDAWNRYWFRPQPPHSLGIFRLLLGLFFLVLWLLRAPHVSRYFSTAGIHAPMFAAPVGGLDGVRDWTDILGYLIQAVPPWTAWGLYVALHGRGISSRTRMASVLGACNGLSRTVEVP